MKGNGHESLSKWRSVQNDEAGCLPLINSWITISQSLIISSPRTLFSTSPLKMLTVHFIQCATVLSLWEHFILLVWSASYILLTFEPAHCLLESRTACCSIVDSCLPAAALALVLNCSSSLSHWPGNTPTYQKCFVTRPAGASLLWLNHWSRLQPVGHTFNHLSCCSLFKPVNNIECKNAIHRKTIIGGTLKFHKNSWQVLLNA